MFYENQLHIFQKTTY